MAGCLDKSENTTKRNVDLIALSRGNTLVVSSDENRFRF